MSEASKDEIVTAKLLHTAVLTRLSGISTSDVDPIPDKLYLHVSGNVEWSPWSGHAWGTATVTTDKKGKHKYKVDKLKLRIVMNTPEKQDKTESKKNASKVDNDVVWTVVPIPQQDRGPHSVFTATATDERFGTWSTKTTVY